MHAKLIIIILELSGSSAEDIGLVVVVLEVGAVEVITMDSLAVTLNVISNTGCS